MRVVRFGREVLYLQQVWENVLEDAIMKLTIEFDIYLARGVKIARKTRLDKGDDSRSDNGLCENAYAGKSLVDARTVWT